jgi:hypothetical protein
LSWQDSPLLISTGFLKYPLELKKISIRPEKIFQLVCTEFLSQFEIIAEMEISKNQWRSTGGQVEINRCSLEQRKLHSCLQQKHFSKIKSK